MSNAEAGGQKIPESLPFHEIIWGRGGGTKANKTNKQGHVVKR